EQKEGTTHFLQIWIEPDQRGIAPSYEEKHFTQAQKRGRLQLVASPDGREGSVRIHQQATLHAGLFDGGECGSLPIGEGRRAYVHVARGAVRVNGHRLGAGDALELTGEREVAIDQGEAAEVLVFELP